MNNHLNILPKQASFDLKCSKMCWRLGLRLGSLRRSPRLPSRQGLRAFGARNSFFLSPLIFFYTPNPTFLELPLEQPHFCWARFAPAIRPSHWNF